MFRRFNILVIFFFIGSFATAQLPQGIILDGSYTLTEMYDAEYFKHLTTKTPDVVIKEGNDHFYLNIHSASIVTMAIYKNDSLYILHVSGSVTMGTYFIGKSNQNKAILSRSIYPVANRPETWGFIGPFVSQRFFKKVKSDTEVQSELTHCLNANGYTATTFDMGSRYDFEILLQKDLLKGAKIMIAYNDRYGKSVKFPSDVLLTGKNEMDEHIYNAELEKAGQFVLNSKDWFIIN